MNRVGNRRQLRIARLPRRTIHPMRIDIEGDRPVFEHWHLDWYYQFFRPIRFLPSLVERVDSRFPEKVLDDELGEIYSLNYSCIPRGDLRRKENPLFNAEVCGRLGRCIKDTKCFVNLVLNHAQLDDDCVRALLLPWTRYNTEYNPLENFLQNDRDEESEPAEGKSEGGIIALDLSSNRKISPDGIMHLSHLFCNYAVLRELRLGDMRMGIEGVTALVDIISGKHTTLKSLKVLDVRYNRLKNEGASVLCRALRSDCPELDKIHLCGNGISDYESFSLLLEKQLDRDKYDLPPDSPQFSPQLRLRVLDLSGNPIDDNCINLVADALDGNRRLTHLDLRCNTTMTQAGWNRLHSLVLNCQSFETLEESNHTLISFGCSEPEVPMRFPTKKMMVQLLKLNADGTLSNGAKKRKKLLWGLEKPDIGEECIPFALSMLNKEPFQSAKEVNRLDLFYGRMRDENILSLFKAVT